MAGGKSAQDMNARERRAAARAASATSVPEQETSFLDLQKVQETVEHLVVDEFNLVLESLSSHGAGSNRTLEIVIDYPEDRTDSLSLDTVAEVSQAISAALDSVDGTDNPYLLEVSSPGATRPLEKPRHWKRSVGRLIEVLPVEGAEKYLARLHEVTEAGPLLAVKKNTKKGQKESYRDAQVVPWDSIDSAKVEIEFNQ